MRSNVIIKKENSNGYLINNNPIEIIKNIFNIEGKFEIKKENNKYFVFCNDKLLCSYIVSYEELYDYIISISYKNCVYQFYCDEDSNSLKINLHEYYFFEKDKNIRIVNNGYGVSTDISKEHNAMSVELEKKDINLKQFENIVRTFELKDSLEIIYNKLSCLQANDNLKIKKYTFYNLDENVSDLLVIRDGNLKEYFTSVSKNVDNNVLNYVLKKDSNGYSVAFLNNSIDLIRNSYFALDEQVGFVRQIESKKRVLSK